MPCGTTGEGATLIGRASPGRSRSASSGRRQGAGDRRLRLEQHQAGDRHTRAAKEAGADAALMCRLITTGPTRTGSTPISRRWPRRSISRSSSTTCRRGRSPTSRSRRWRGSPDPNIVGVKDATGNLARVTAQRLACGADFIQLRAMTRWRWASTRWAGRAASRSPPMSRRAFAPSSRTHAFQAMDGALALQDRLYPLHAALFSDASPGPVKYALGRVRPDFASDLRLPMTPPSEASRRAVDAALAHAGLA